MRIKRLGISLLLLLAHLAVIYLKIFASHSMILYDLLMQLIDKPILRLIVEQGFAGLCLGLLVLLTIMYVRIINNTVINLKKFYCVCLGFILIGISILLMSLEYVPVMLFAFDVSRYLFCYGIVAVFLGALLSRPFNETQWNNK